MIKRTLYFGNPAYLSLKNSQLSFFLLENDNFKIISEVKQKDKPRTIPIEDIGFVVLDHRQITITQGLLDALTNNGTGVITCGANHMPTGMLLPLNANTLQSERFLSQINISLPLKKQLWQQTVRAKIFNQAAVIETKFNIPATNMLRWADEVKSNDSLNLEARSAAFYWKNIFPDIDDFRRDPDGCYPNAL